jgi:hypothetical protein
VVVRLLSQGILQLGLGEAVVRLSPDSWTAVPAVARIALKEEGEGTSMIDQQKQQQS